MADDRARTPPAVTVTTDDVARRAYELYLSRGGGGAGRMLTTSYGRNRT